jgi:hypothetical protein
MHWAGQVVEQLLYDESYDDAVVGDQRNIRELTKYAERHDIDCKLLQARNDAVVFMEEFLRNRWQTFNQLSGNLTKSGTLNAEEIEPYLIR